MSTTDSQLDPALLQMIQASEAPIAISAATGESRAIEARISAARARSDVTPGSCYSHSSWGN